MVRFSTGTGSAPCRTSAGETDLDINQLDISLTIKTLNILTTNKCDCACNCKKSYYTKSLFHNIADITALSKFTNKSACKGDKPKQLPQAQPAKTHCQALESKAGICGCGDMRYAIFGARLVTGEQQKPHHFCLMELSIATHPRNHCTPKKKKNPT